MEKPNQGAFFWFCIGADPDNIAMMQTRPKGSKLEIRPIRKKLPVHSGPVIDRTEESEINAKRVGNVEPTDVDYNRFSELCYSLEPKDAYVIHHIISTRQEKVCTVGTKWTTFEAETLTPETFWTAFSYAVDCEGSASADHSRSTAIERLAKNKDAFIDGCRSARTNPVILDRVQTVPKFPKFPVGAKKKLTIRSVKK